MGKEENAGNQHFLIFLRCFQPFSKQISILQSHLFCCLEVLLIKVDQSKMLSFGKELNPCFYTPFEKTVGK